MNINQQFSASEAHQTAHDNINLLLPWWVNGTLDEDEAAAVKQHLGMCLVCQREVRALQSLATGLSARSGSAQSAAALERLHARIDESPALASATGFPWAAAAVLVLVTALTTLLGFNTGLLGDESSGRAFSTLGARTVQVTSESLVTARIVFEEDITEIQLRKLLLDADAELIDGPTRRGTYTIALPNVDPNVDLQIAVNKLRQSERVLFIEPIKGIGASR